MAAHPLNDDVATQILLHLPLQSLLRFQTVSKLWRDVIDSSFFRKSHLAINNNNDNEDDRVALIHLKLFTKSLILVDTGKSPDIPALTESSMTPDRIVTASSFFAGPVNGLICIHDKIIYGPLIACNPSLGQIKSLPLRRPCHDADEISVGLGSDEAVHKYKVVQLLSCHYHRRIHASVYSKTTNSWRDLACNGGYICIREGIKSFGINRGDVAHWLGVRVEGDEDVNYIILSFEMKTEVFRIFEMPDSQTPKGIDHGKIFAKGDTFAFFRLDDDMWMTEYEARFEKDYNNNYTLRWEIMKKVVFRPLDGFEIMRGNYSVVFNQFVLIQASIRGRETWKAIFYSLDDEEIVRSFELPGRWDVGKIFKVLEYKGSFVSP